MMLGIVSPASLCAVELTGVAAVNITSDTAANAKTMALDEARRQIISDVLAPYSAVEQLRSVVANAPADELTGLIQSSGIDGERLSDTTYSANIKMTIDAAVARRWLTENNIQNWLADGDGADMAIMIITVGDDGIADWSDINRIARNEQVSMTIRHIIGDQVTVAIPASRRGRLTIALREGGWQYANRDGALRVWKH